LPNKTLPISKTDYQQSLRSIYSFCQMLAHVPVKLIHVLTQVFTFLSLLTLVLYGGCGS
jgi:hypothetical protein